MRTIIVLALSALAALDGILVGSVVSPGEPGLPAVVKEHEEIAHPAREEDHVVIEIGTITIVPEAPPARARKKVWGCSGWKDSQVGGSYKACEWK